MMIMKRLTALLILILICPSLLSAQEATPEMTPESTAEPEKTDDPQGAPTVRSEFTPYAWGAANLAVFVPSDTALTDENGILTASGEDGTITYALVQTETAFADAQLYDQLDAAMRADGLTLTTYERLTLWGRTGWRVDGVDFATGLLARGRIGRLPDDRILVIVVRAADEITLARRADAAAYGLVFSADSTPRIPDALPPSRVGDEALRSRVPVQGTVSDADPTQRWTYSGRAGERVSFMAVDLARFNVFDLGLDMAIRVFNPDGTEFGYNDDQVGTDLFGAYDAILANVTLPQAGTYTVQIEWVAGAGTYTLGVSDEVPVTLMNDLMPLSLGAITNVFPFHRYVIEVMQGQTLTFTMTTVSGTLDPTLEVLTDDGRSLAFNDDALLDSQPTAAQVTVTFPADGAYTVQAGRFSGAGDYQIEVEGL